MYPLWISTLILNSEYFYSLVYSWNLVDYCNDHYCFFFVFDHISIQLISKFASVHITKLTHQSDGCVYSYSVQTYLSKYRQFGATRIELYPRKLIWSNWDCSSAESTWKSQSSWNLCRIGQMCKEMWLETDLTKFDVNITWKAELS